MVANCQAAYEQAPPALRRTLNQVFFEKIKLDQDDIAEAELTTEMELLLLGRGSRENGKSGPDPSLLGIGSSKGYLVDPTGIEPVASAMPWRRSTK